MRRARRSVDGAGLGIDESVYAQCLPDNNPYEGAFLQPTCDYDLQALRDENGGYDLLKGPMEATR